MGLHISRVGFSLLSFRTQALDGYHMLAFRELSSSSFLPMVDNQTLSIIQINPLRSSENISFPAPRTSTSSSPGS